MKYEVVSPDFDSTITLPEISWGLLFALLLVMCTQKLGQCHPVSHEQHYTVYLPNLLKSWPPNHCLLINTEQQVRLYLIAISRDKFKDGRPRRHLFSAVDTVYKPISVRETC
jgi:hypothetical protein